MSGTLYITTETLRRTAVNELPDHFMLTFTTADGWQLFALSGSIDLDAATLIGGEILLDVDGVEVADMPKHV